MATMTKNDTSSVPLMMDMDGEEENMGGVESGLEKDFSFNNNVAGASKHIRLGRLIQIYCHSLVE